MRMLRLHPLKSPQKLPNLRSWFLEPAPHCWRPSLVALHEDCPAVTQSARRLASGGMKVRLEVTENDMHDINLALPLGN